MDTFFRARVENNGFAKDFLGKDAVTDPQSRGRVQVRILGLHDFSNADTTTDFKDTPDGADGIPLKHLPWAEQAGTLMFGGFSTRAGADKSKQGYTLDPGGVSMIPNVGSWVWIFLEQNDPMKPVYFASIPGTGDMYALTDDNVTMIITKSGHRIKIDDTVDSSGNSTGAIELLYNDENSGGGTKVPTLLRLSTKEITISAELVFISANKIKLGTASSNGEKFIVASSSKSDVPAPEDLTILKDVNG